MKDLIQRLQSEKIPNEEKPVEKVKFFAEEVREKIQNEKNPEEKPKNTVQSEKTQNKNSTHLEEFWAEFDENSETPHTGDGNEKDNVAEELFQVVQLENNTAEIVTTVSAWLD